jgi:AcrR family transcriptional regulator
MDILVNMITKKGKQGDAGVDPRKRGRPRGRTEQGLASRARLFAVALELIAARGYEGTTLRDIAREAGVSPALLYRYFPSKRAVVLALYDDLSAAYAVRAAEMRPGPWRARFLFALRTSLEVLGPHRPALATLAGILVGDENEGLFAPATLFSRRRVQAVFTQAVRGASDAPEERDAEALGRLLYVAHLAVILWWLLDRSPRQRGTGELVRRLERALPMISLALRLPPARRMLRTAERLCARSLFGEEV